MTLLVELKNLSVDELECDELRVVHLTADTINGITKEELNCLKGVKGNIQQQIDKLNKELDDLIACWS